MPTKLKFLVVLMALTLVMNLVTQSWFALGIGILLLVGVLSGSDSVRGLLIGFGWFGVVSASVAILFGVAAFGTSHDHGTRSDNKSNPELHALTHERDEAARFDRELGGRSCVELIRDA